MEFLTELGISDDWFDTALDITADVVTDSKEVSEAVLSMIKNIKKEALLDESTSISVYEKKLILAGMMLKGAIDHYSEFMLQETKRRMGV